MKYLLPAAVATATYSKICVSRFYLSHGLLALR
jgi:hypothetical protein